MCTVTYLPESGNNFILTSSRDEKASRSPAIPPIVKKIGNKEVLFPQDKGAGGTWIAVDKEGRLVCLLNGAFKKHISDPPYKKSRGLVALDYFLFAESEIFFKQYELSGIEPFTMIVHDTKLYEFRWDGKKKYLSQPDINSPHIWSSATLYTDGVIDKRKQWFKEWLIKKQTGSVEKIRKFHHLAGEGDLENAIKVNRGALFTVSITSIVKEKTGSLMIYEDLTKNESYTVRI